MAHRTRPIDLIAAAALLLAAPAFAGEPACPDAGMVLGEQKISALEGGFGGELDASDEFGRAVANVGDLDGDGVSELAVGLRLDDDGAMDRGAVWILFLNADRTVKSEQKISSTAGGFGGQLEESDWFGVAVAALGDLDGDGVPELAVGAHGDNNGGPNRGAVWILFLNGDGTVKSEQKISDTAGGFGGQLDDFDEFGTSVAGLGDLDGDGVPDLAVGAWVDDDGGTDRGAVWVLFLNTNGTVKGDQKISSAAGGFGGQLDNDDHFGISVGLLGDLDGDGLADLAVGAYDDDDGGTNRGAVWILFLNSDGMVKSEQKISSTAGGFGGQLDNLDRFGVSVAAIGDLDGDGETDLAAGAHVDDDGGTERGAVWILFLNTDGTVKDEWKISSTAGGFGGQLDNLDRFGISVAAMSEFEAGGVTDLAVGAYRDDDGDADAGAVWILSLDDGKASRDCPADTVPDGVIDSSDLNAVLALFGQSINSGCTPDTNADGVIDSQDLNAVLARFGSACGG